MSDEDEFEFPSSSSSDREFFLVEHAATRPSSYYPVAFRNNSTANVVPQGRYPVIRLQPQGSSH